MEDEADSAAEVLEEAALELLEKAEEAAAAAEEDDEEAAEVVVAAAAEVEEAEELAEELRLRDGKRKSSFDRAKEGETNEPVGRAVSDGSGSVVADVSVSVGDIDGDLCEGNG